MVKIKLFTRSFKDIEPLVPTTIYSCLIYLYNSLLILFLEVIVSYSKPGLYKQRSVKSLPS